jgi:hypothetical protein
MERRNRRRQGLLPGTPAQSLKECFACGEKSGRNRLLLSPCRRFRPGPHLLGKARPLAVGIWARDGDRESQTSRRPNTAKIAIQKGSVFLRRQGACLAGRMGRWGRNHGTARVGAVPSPHPSFSSRSVHIFLSGWVSGVTPNCGDFIWNCGLLAISRFSRRHWRRLYERTAPIERYPGYPC